METPIPEYIGSACCALVQVTAGDSYNMSYLKNQVKRMKILGYRAIFVITKEDEPNLVKRLEELGFEEIATFDRRKEYPQTPLKMWLKKI